MSFLVCPKPGPGIPSAYTVIFFVINDLKWEVFIRFVDIGGIVDHYHINFLSITFVVKVTELQCIYDLSVLRFNNRTTYLSKIIYLIL